MNMQSPKEIEQDERDIEVLDLEDELSDLSEFAYEPNDCTSND